MNNELPNQNPYSITEASRILGVSPTTLRRWEDEGRLTPARTPGGDRRFSPDDIQNILQSFRKETDQRLNTEVETLPPLPPNPDPVTPPPPPLIPIRQIENYRPRRPRPYFHLALTLTFLLTGYIFFSSIPLLTKMRLERAFSPGPANPIVDVNDALEYKITETGELRLGLKFPVDIGVLFAKSLNVAEDAILNTARFLGTVFFGNGDDYFISPTGDASFNSVNSGTISVTSLNVENLTVSGTSIGVTGAGGGGGGIATGGDADTLEGQGGSYYLSWANATGTPTILSSLDGVTNNEGNIDLIAGANIVLTPDDGANTITITSIAGSDAATLDGLDSLQFLPSDTDDSFTAGTLTIADGTTLTVNSTAINLGNAVTDLVIFNGAIDSDIIPSLNAQYDLGSAGLRWDIGFFDEIVVNTLSAGASDISGTISSDFSINTDNSTADTQDATLTFIRGTSSPNAVLRWDSTLDQYLFESFPLALDGQLISGVTTGTSPFSISSTTLVTNLNADLLDDQTGSYYLDLANEVGTCSNCLTGSEIDESTLAGVNADLLDSLNSDQFLRSDTDDSFTGTGTLTTDSGTTVDINGSLAWGGATVTEDLDMATNIISNIGDAGTDFDTDGGLTLAGDLTVTGGEIFLNPIASSGSTTEGTIYYDSDNDRLFVYANGAFARLATDMTKYTATDAALANAGYVEIAHNQSTNDLSLTAWYYDSLLGQYRTIENFTTTISQDLQNEFDDAPAGGKIRTQTVASIGGSDIRLQQSADLGNGADGAITVSSNPTNINTTNLIVGRTCADGGDAVNYSITALTSTTATLSVSPSSGCLVAGGEILLIALQGSVSSTTNIGNYETLRIQSISTNVVTFVTAKTKFYGDVAGADTNIGTGGTNHKVMLQRVPNYTNVTVDTGVSFTPSAWNGTKNGVMFFRASGTVETVGTGTINANSLGYAGAAGGEDQVEAAAVGPLGELIGDEMRLVRNHLGTGDLDAALFQPPLQGRAAAVSSLACGTAVAQCQYGCTHVVCSLNCGVRLGACG